MRRRERGLSYKIYVVFMGNEVMGYYLGRSYFSGIKRFRVECELIGLINKIQIGIIFSVFGLSMI